MSVFKRVWFFFFLLINLKRVFFQNQLLTRKKWIYRVPNLKYLLRKYLFLKEATGFDINLLVSVMLSNFKHLTWLETVSAWNSEYLASSKALWTKSFFPTIFQQLKCKTFFTDSKLSQIITGHGKFKSYLKEFS